MPYGYGGYGGHGGFGGFGCGFNSCWIWIIILIIFFFCCGGCGFSGYGASGTAPVGEYY